MAISENGASILFSMQSALGISCHIFHNYHHFYHFYREWECYKTRYGGLSLKFISRQTFIRVLQINIFLNLICFVFIFLLIFKAPKSYIDGFLPLDKRLATYCSEKTYLVVHSIVHLYLSMVWFQTILHCITIIFLLRKEFQLLSQEFSCDINEGQQNSKLQQEKGIRNVNTINLYNAQIPTIENYRQRHYYLCRIVAIYDKGISLYLLFLYLFSIPIIVILLYATSGLEKGATQENFYSEFMAIMSLFTFVIIVVTITISASNLATMVRTFYAILSKFLFTHSSLICNDQ